MFRPVYTQSIKDYELENKIYDYKVKKFSTVTKKNDPVARFQNLQKLWSQEKFLKSNFNSDKAGSKQGRKLRLSERFLSEKPVELFHRY